MCNETIQYILYAVALAMGVATVVLNTLGQTVDLTLLGIGMFCLGVAGLNSTDMGKGKKRKKH